MPIYESTPHELAKPETGRKRKKLSDEEEVEDDEEEEEERGTGKKEKEAKRRNNLKALVRDLFLAKSRKRLERRQEQS